MAKLVLVNNYSYREGINEIGDIVDIVDENVELTGPGYFDEKGNSKFTILIIQGLTKADVKTKQKELWPERKIVGEDRFWLDPEDGFWYHIQKVSKYMFSTKNLSQQNLSKLQQENVTTEEKLNIIGLVPAKFTTIVDNTTTTEHMLLMYSEFG